MACTVLIVRQDGLILFASHSLVANDFSVVYIDIDKLILDHNILPCSLQRLYLLVNTWMVLVLIFLVLILLVVNFVFVRGL